MTFKIEEEKKGTHLPAFFCRLEKPNWFLLRLPFCKSCQFIPCHARVCCPSICCPCLPFVFLGKQALTGVVALTDWQSGSNISRAQKHNNLGQNYDHWGPLIQQRQKSRVGVDDNKAVNDWQIGWHTKALSKHCHLGWTDSSAWPFCPTLPRENTELI